MQRSPLTQKQTRYMILGIVLILACLGLYYIGTHGRLTVSNLGDKEITLTTLQGEGLVTDSSIIRSGAFVKSGEYVLSNKTEGYSRLARVTVRGWLANTTIELEPMKSANINRAAALTYENFFQADDQTLVSLTSLSNFASGYTIHKNDDAFGSEYTDVAFPSVLQTVGITKSGQLLGLDSESRIQTYSFGTKTFTPLKSIAEDVNPKEHNDSHDEESPLTPTIKRSSNTTSDVAGAYVPRSRSLHIVNSQSRQTQKVTLPLSPSDSATFDTTDKKYVYVESPIETEERSNDPHDEERNQTYKATVRTLDGNERTTVELGKAKDIADIALSPSGEYLAVIKDSRLWVYKTSDGSVAIADLLHPTTQLFWNDSKLYRMTVEQGLGVFDTATQQLVPIKMSGFGSLAYSIATPIGSKIYLSAFNKNEDSELADGYIIDLDSKDTQITEKLSKQLPYRSNSYEITYLNNTIYIRSSYLARTVNDPYLNQIRDEARAKVNELIDKTTLAQSHIVFTN